MFAETEWKTDAPLVIAHRGASEVAPENTIAAFQKAVELGADAIELDVKLTADGEALVMHDRTLDRTTSGSGRVSAHTMSEIQTLDAGSYFSDQFEGERVPTLREVLETFGDGLLYNVELTNYASPWDDLPRVVHGVVGAVGLQRQVLISSFNPIALRRYSRLAEDAPVALLVGEMQPAWIRRMFAQLARHQAVHPQDGLVGKDVVGRIHRAGLRVNVWTVNDVGRMRELLTFGVDGIITDLPDVARAIVGEGGRKSLWTGWKGGGHEGAMSPTLRG